MSCNKKAISKAVEELMDNLDSVARVYEWAALMGYGNPQNFSRQFLRHYNIRPHKVITLMRLRSIVTSLCNNSDRTNYEIARLHSMPDEKALNNFMNYHLGCSPSHIRNMTPEQVQERLEILGNEFREYIQGMHLTNSTIIL